MASFLREIQQLKKIGLKKVDTYVTTPTGARYLEARNGDNFDSQFLASKNESVFYVVDYKPDLQVGIIKSYLFLGSVDAAGDLELLNSFGVTHILNVTTEKMELYPDKFVYCHVPMLDLPQEKLIEKLNRCFDFISAAQLTNGKVLVHCMAGISRSASVVIAYLMHCDGTSFEQALEKVKSCRPSINPNEGFRRQLDIWGSTGNS